MSKRKDKQLERMINPPLAIIDKDKQAQKLTKELKEKLDKIIGHLQTCPLCKFGEPRSPGKLQIAVDATVFFDIGATERTDDTLHDDRWLVCDGCGADSKENGPIKERWQLIQELELENIL